MRKSKIILLVITLAVALAVSSCATATPNQNANSTPNPNGTPQVQRSRLAQPTVTFPPFNTNTPYPTETAAPTSTQQLPFTLTSPDFKSNTTIPVDNTCEGKNISPKLEWSNPPAGTQSYTLIVEDPDALNFTHWIIYNIPGTATSLPEGLPRLDQLPDGSQQGLTDNGFVGYGGPCPPRLHHYTFTLYAMSSKVDLVSGTPKANLLKVMQGLIQGQVQLVGTYGK